MAPSVVYELTKNDLAPILAARRQFAEDLSRALAQRQATGRAVVAAGPRTTDPAAGLGAWFSERVHELFDRRSVG